MRRTFTRPLIALTLAALAVPAIAFTAPQASESSELAQLVSMMKDEIRLVAKMRESGVRGKAKAKYRERTKKGQVEKRFKVQVQRGEPSTDYAITVDGNVIGTLRTNTRGYGELHFRTHSDDPDHIPTVPNVSVGTVVQIGPFEGAMRVK